MWLKSEWHLRDLANLCFRLFRTAHTHTFIETQYHNVSLSLFLFLAHSLCHFLLRFKFRFEAETSFHNFRLRPFSASRSQIVLKMGDKETPVKIWTEKFTTPKLFLKNNRYSILFEMNFHLRPFGSFSLAERGKHKIGLCCCYSFFCSC